MEHDHDNPSFPALPGLVAELIEHSRNVDALLDGVLDQTLDAFGLHAGWVYLYDDHADLWRLVCQRQTQAEGSAPDPSPTPDLPTALRLGAMIVVPLMNQEEVVGVMELASLESHGFTSAEQTLLKSIGQDLGVAIVRLIDKRTTAQGDRAAAA
jgi:GAF domain-containing protein